MFLRQYLAARAVWQGKGIVGFLIVALVVGFMLTPAPSPEQLAKQERDEVVELKPQLAQCVFTDWDVRHNNDGAGPMKDDYSPPDRRYTAWTNSHPYEIDTWTAERLVTDAKVSGDGLAEAQGGVGPWLQHVRSLATTWFHRLKPLQGWPRAHIEPMGNAYSIIETARSQGLSPNEIDTKFVTLGKDGRALAVEPHSTGGRVKIGRSALDKRTNYRGVVANHLVRQVTGFRAFDKDALRREDDLFDAAMYAVLVSLGDGTEARWSRLKRAPMIT
jgi:hypothetical protein